MGFFLVPPKKRSKKQNKTPKKRKEKSDAEWTYKKNAIGKVDDELEKFDERRWKHLNDGADRKSQA